MATKTLGLLAGAVLSFGIGVAHADENRRPAILDTMNVVAYEPLGTDRMAVTTGGGVMVGDIIRDILHKKHDDGHKPMKPPMHKDNNAKAVADANATATAKGPHFALAKTDTNTSAIVTSASATATASSRSLSVAR
jgi:hypothetical protein